MAAFWIGMSSLLIWICCQAPQFIKNIKQGSADALSCWFLLEWLSGDILNLVGALLSGQQKTQIFTAVLFMCMDSCMLSQYLYYRRKNRKQRLADAEITNDLTADLLSSDQADPFDPSNPSNPSSPRRHSDSSPALSALGSSGKVLAYASLPIVAQAFVLQSDDPCAVSVSHRQVQIGWWIGWVSAVIYLNSRIPQIIKNFRRKYTGGLSVLMFACAVMGNVTYGLGVVIRANGWSDYEHALPWLVGSLGTVVLDFTIISQVCFYPKHKSSSGTPGSKSPSPLGSPVPDGLGSKLLPKAYHAIHDPLSRVGNVKPLYLLKSSRSIRANSF
eukprot:c5756_g1_i1.p1 GENE.c5756_g1_i1~~c5756_g1_i1.p1  ORF type:complete len:374 (-),score=71.33 c5756_g1_i1:31-1020(-)